MLISLLKRIVCIIICFVDEQKNISAKVETKRRHKKSARKPQLHANRLCWKKHAQTHIEFHCAECFPFFSPKQYKYNVFAWDYFWCCSCFSCTEFFSLAIETKRYETKKTYCSPPHFVVKIMNLNTIDRCDECGGILINATVNLFVFHIARIQHWQRITDKNTLAGYWLRIFSHKFTMCVCLQCMHMWVRIFFKSIFHFKIWFPREKKNKWLQTRMKLNKWSRSRPKRASFSLIILV